MKPMKNIQATECPSWGIKPAHDAYTQLLALGVISAVVNVLSHARWADKTYVVKDNQAVVGGKVVTLGESDEDGNQVILLKWPAAGSINTFDKATMTTPMPDPYANAPKPPKEIPYPHATKYRGYASYEDWANAKDGTGGVRREDLLS